MGLPDTTADSVRWDDYVYKYDHNKGHYVATHRGSKHYIPQTLSQSDDLIECGSIKSDVIFSENDIYEAALPAMPPKLTNAYTYDTP